MNVQAVSDAHSRFIFVSFDNPGATHDTKAFSFSALGGAILAGGLLQGFYLLGDAYLLASPVTVQVNKLRVCEKNE